MAILKIVKYGDPVLRTETEPVSEIDDALKERITDMVQTMYAAPGVGLAANQVGWGIRVAVIDVTAGEKPGELLVLINPEVVSTEGQESAEEGCLSVPGFTEIVERPTRVKVRAQNLEGQTVEIEGEGLLARALMHEVDHLDGKVFFDHISRLKKELILKRIQKLTKTDEWT